MKYICLIILFLSTNLVTAASFDCTKASTDFEKSICNDKQLSDLDEKLAEAYKKVKSTSDNANIKQDQLAWIKKTRKCGGDSNCTQAKYQERLVILNKLLETKVENIKEATPTTEVSSSQTAGASSGESIQKLFAGVKECVKTKNFQCAKESLNEILKLDQNNMTAKVGLVNVEMFVCLDAKNFDCAVQNAQKWMQLTPEDQNAQIALSKIQSAMASQALSKPVPSNEPTSNSFAQVIKNMEQDKINQEQQVKERFNQSLAEEQKYYDQRELVATKEKEEQALEEAKKEQAVAEFKNKAMEEKAFNENKAKEEQALELKKSEEAVTQKNIPSPDLIAKFKSLYCKNIDSNTKGEFSYKELVTGDLCLAPEIVLSNVTRILFSDIVVGEFSTIPLYEFRDWKKGTLGIDFPDDLLKRLSNEEYEFGKFYVVYLKNIEKIYLTYMSVITCGEHEKNSLAEGNSYRKALENKYGDIDDSLKNNMGKVLGLDDLNIYEKDKLEQDPFAKALLSEVNEVDKEIREVLWETEGAPSFSVALGGPGGQRSVPCPIDEHKGNVPTFSFIYGPTTKLAKFIQNQNKLDVEAEKKIGETADTPAFLR